MVILTALQFLDVWQVCSAFRTMAATSVRQLISPERSVYEEWSCPYRLPITQTTPPGAK